MALIQIEEQIIVSQYLKDIGGYSWSYTSRLGDMLTHAQNLFGERDKDFTILGIEFIDGGPSIYYIGNKQIIIHLPKARLQDHIQGIYELSQEAFHCLSLIPGTPANILEEGLSCHFAEFYMKHAGFGEGWSPNSNKYREAKTKAGELLAVDNDLIKKVRKIQAKISLITKEQILSINDSVPEPLVEFLTSQF
jgi:hypothetical protein